MQVYIGVDGGGTKTRMVAVTADGQLVADLVGDGSNVNRHGWERGFSVLEGMFAKIRARLPEGSEVAVVYLGLAGVDREPQRQRMLSFAKEQWPKALVCVENDARIALASQGGQRAGIVLIAGTGSIAFGINEAGEHARVGGWGYLIGDEGSGYDIGRQALQTVMRSFEGRGLPTVLQKKVLAKYELAEPTALIPLVYAESFSREKMAEVARIVLEAAAEGDAESLRLLRQAAEELCLLVKTLLERLAFAAQEVSVVLTGGVLQQGNLLADLVRAQLEAGWAVLNGRPAPALQVTVNERPPVVGAVRLALQEADALMVPPLSELLGAIPA